MWLSKIGGSILRFMGTKIDAGLGMWSNLGKDTESNIDTNFGIESRKKLEFTFLFKFNFIEMKTY